MFRRENHLLYILIIFVKEIYEKYKKERVNITKKLYYPFFLMIYLIIL